MLRVETVGIIEDRKYIACLMDEGDREVIEKYIGLESDQPITTFVSISEGVGIDLKEVLDGVSRPVANRTQLDKIKKCIKELNGILFPKPITVTLS